MTPADALDLGRRVGATICRGTGPWVDDVAQAAALAALAADPAHARHEAWCAAMDEFRRLTQLGRWRTVAPYFLVPDAGFTEPTFDTYDLGPLVPWLTTRDAAALELLGAGYSQHQAAELVGVHRSTVAELVRRVRRHLQHAAAS